MMTSISDSKSSSAAPEPEHCRVAAGELAFFFLCLLTLFMALLPHPSLGAEERAPTPLLFHFEGNRQLDDAQLRTAVAEELADLMLQDECRERAESTPGTVASGGYEAGDHEMDQVAVSGTTIRESAHESTREAAPSPQGAAIPCDRLRLVDIDDASYQLQLLYRRAGYYFAEVDYQLDSEQQAPKIRFLINEGPMVQVGTISSQGNTVFSDQKLISIVKESLRNGGPGSEPLPLAPLFHLPNLPNLPNLVEARLRQALGEIRELYLKDGYREVKVSSDTLRFGPQGLSAEEFYETRFSPLGEPIAGESTTTTEPPTLKVTITLLIEEGLRRIISDIRLTEVASTELSDPKPDSPVSASNLTSGHASNHASGHASGLPPEVVKALEESAKELIGLPYFTRRKLLLRSRLLAAYQQLGYPEAQITVGDQAGATPGDIILQAEINSGPLVKISDIEVSGQQRTSPDFIRQRLSLAPGDIYSNDARQDSFRELYRTGLFTRVDIELLPGVAKNNGNSGNSKESGVPPTPPAIDTPSATPRTLLVTVEEGSSREYFLEGGWGSYEMLRGRVGYIDRNIFGSGRIFRVESGASLKGAEIKTGVTDPWLLESNVTAEIPLYYRLRQEPSFTRSEFGVALLLSRPLPHDLTASLGYQIRRSDIDKIEADTGLESLESGYGIASIKFQLNHDTRNDIFFPSAGRRAFGAVEVAAKALGSELEFYRFNAGWRHFYSLNPRLVLGLRADSGLILPGGNQGSIPLGERFYNGGENSVRSFREGRLGPKDLSGQPVGGMAFNLLSIELRQRLSNNWALSLFADYGNVAPNKSRSEEGKTTAADRSELIRDTLGDYFQDFRPALGAGVQYLLPVGPARLDIAFNPTRRAKSHEPDFVIHFSLGMAF